MTRREFLREGMLTAAAVLLGSDTKADSPRLELPPVVDRVEDKTRIEKEKKGKKLFITFIEQILFEISLHESAALRCISPFFLPKYIDDTELTLSLVGPKTLGKDSKRLANHYNSQQYFSRNDLRGEESGSWSNLVDYLQEDIKEEQFMDLLVENMRLLTGIALDKKKILVKRNKDGVIHDVKYFGENVHYEVPIYDKENGKWTTNNHSYSLVNRNHHLIFPPRADGKIKIPVGLLREMTNAQVTLHIDSKSYIFSVPVEEILKPQKIETTPSLKDLAKHIIQQAKTVEEKVRRIHRFVSKEIKYSNVSEGYAKPDEVILNGMAQCKESTLLAIALLNAVGVDCRYFSVDTNLGPHAAVGVPGKYPGKKPFFIRNDIGYYYMETTTDKGVRSIGEHGFEKCILIESHFYPAN
ncbi:MAG: hypothetical protein HYV41_04400 [Candidatus Magasanikbacteria bacterium]|nr:hypothetical protein [Candidatus Magasanikbacteria bacterium]